MSLNYENKKFQNFFFLHLFRSLYFILKKVNFLRIFCGIFFLRIFVVIFVVNFLSFFCEYFSYFFFQIPIFSNFFRSLYFILKKGHRHNFTYHNSSYVFVLILFLVGIYFCLLLLLFDNLLFFVFLMVLMDPKLFGQVVLTSLLGYEICPFDRLCSAKRYLTSENNF